MNGSVLRVYDDARALAEGAATVLAARIREAIAERGWCFLALAGGSTPRATYEEIARRTGGEPELWARTHALWSDERCVPPWDLRSNERMAREALIGRVPLPRAQVHPLRCEGDPEAAARGYEDLLRELLGVAPRLDLVVLGLGEDGHTASLLPGSPVLGETTRLVAAARRPGEPHARVTLTLPALGAAALVLFLVSGEAKAPALRRAVTGDRDLPAARVQPSHGQVSWLVDAAAASLLELEGES